MITAQNDYVVTIVSDTVFPNGKKYFKFSNGKFERIDSATMNVYKFNNGSECLIDSLLARKNDTMTSCRYLLSSRSNFYDTMTVLFAGQQIKVKNMRYSDLVGEYYYLMEGIGIHTHGVCEFSGMREYLNGCVINGVQYGNIISAENNSSAVPKDFILYQNYPNPFNPSTVIKYDITKSGNVQLIVYDTQGKEIKNLVHENKTPGIYEVEFSGEEFASGLYFYKLKVDGVLIDIKKMVLLK